MPPFINIRGLTKRFGNHLIIDQLGLTINAGEIVIFQGPSGIGKSTFLRCLTYLEPFQSGTIRVGDVTLNGGMDERLHRQEILALRKQLGFVFQFFNLFPHLTVADNLMLGPIHVLGESPEKARTEAIDLLRRIGLVSKADAFPHALSGGQQQRVGIARALAMHPKGILFDEPTSSLDPLMKEEIIRVIEDFAHEHFTMLIVTHEPALIQKIATRRITFGDGCEVTKDERITERS